MSNLADWTLQVYARSMAKDYLGWQKCLWFLHSLVWDITYDIWLFQGVDDSSCSPMWVREACEWENLDYLGLSFLHSLVQDINSHTWLFDGKDNPSSNSMCVRKSCDWVVLD